MDDLKPSSFHMYRLYFKGFVSEETTGFGVAICDQEDNLLFHIRSSSHHDSAITVLEAELAALKRGLTEAVGLGINHISLYCDHDEIFELVSGLSTPGHDKIALLIDDVQCIRKQFTSSTPVLMTRNQAKFAYKLAMETVVSKISIHMPPAERNTERKTCSICFNDDFEAEHMFSVDLCGHQFCVECVKLHIEVRLLEGSGMSCLHHECKSKLTLTSCANLLTPELREMWELRIKEDSVPVVERVYCPNPRCLALNLMSKTGDGTMKCCSKCRKPFCINCKVPWHSNLSCEEYKRLGRNPTTKMRQKCRKCQYMNELSKYHARVITCRCGYIFCYKCGAEWKDGGCPHQKALADSYRTIGNFVVLFVFGAAIVASLLND